MPVRRDDWKAEPMVSSRQILYEHRLSAIEVNALLEGFKPKGMDDKWFYFAEGEVVHLHRSWGMGRRGARAGARYADLSLRGNPPNRNRLIGTGAVV